MFVFPLRPEHAELRVGAGHVRVAPDERVADLGRRVILY